MINSVNTLEETAFRIMKTEMEFWVDVKALNEHQFVMIDTEGEESKIFTYVNSKISDEIQYRGVLYDSEKRLYFSIGNVCHLLRTRKTFNGEEGFELFLKMEGKFVPQNFMETKYLYVFMELFGI